MSAAKSRSGRSGTADRSVMAYVGQPLNRHEGRAKVTGQARYAADHAPDRLLYAFGVGSAIAAGELVKLDLARAEAEPGVVGVLHRGNFPRLRRSPNSFSNATKVGEVRLPFEDDRIHYAGQYIAVVLGETFEAARAGARLVRAEYRPAPARVTLAEGAWPDGATISEDTPDYTRGDPAKAWMDAPVKIDAVYSTPVEVHNPIELHATVASWRGRQLEVRDSTQWVVGQRNALAAVFGVDPWRVTVLAPHVGGGFGGKLFLWPHTILAAAAARKWGRPVKFVVERRLEFTTVGHRPATRQRVRLGAAEDGAFRSLRHDTLAHTSLVDAFLEEAGATAKALYRCPNVGVTHRLVPLNVGTPTAMRAPGAASGSFALESAVDELAAALELDPIELRRRNEPSRDESQNRPWSNRHLLECFEVAARRFGWSRRSPAPGSMRDGREVLGWGCAAATWPAFRDEASARVELRPDGTATVYCATQDIGTGTISVIAQVAAEVLRLPPDRIVVAIGDSSHPRGPISGGSMATATVAPAVAAAARKALRRPGAGKRVVTAEATTAPGAEERRFAFRSFGAHLVEVRWDPALARLRVARAVTAIDAGRMINPKTAENQILGGVMMGVGMALLERSVYDPRDGRVVTDSLADYLMPVHADAPELETVFLDHPDPRRQEFGGHGVGEIGVVGVAAAVANAAWHATGRRFRELPITVERLLQAPGI